MSFCNTSGLTFFAQRRANDRRRSWAIAKLVSSVRINADSPMLLIFLLTRSTLICSPRPFDNGKTGPRRWLSGELLTSSRNSGAIARNWLLSRFRSSASNLNCWFMNPCQGQYFTESQAGMPQGRIGRSLAERTNCKQSGQFRNGQSTSATRLTSSLCYSFRLANYDRIDSIKFT